MTINDYLKTIERRQLKPSWFRTQEWNQVDVAIRIRSFFSATVESARLLGRMHKMLSDHLSAATEEVTSPDGTKSVAYTETSLGKFRERATDFALAEGVVSEAELGDNRITNVVSNSRLKLIFNTNIEQAQTFATWQATMRNPLFLKRFPAARFVRRPGAITKRPRHVEAENTIRRWDDWEFWEFQNAADIGGFGTPWGPYGFNSYMIQVPVTRADAIAARAITANQQVTPDLSRYGLPDETINKGVTAELSDDIPEPVKEKARARIRSRLGARAIDSKGNPTLDAIRKARARLES